MLKLYFLSIVFLFSSCSKFSNQNIRPTERTDFFSNEKDAFQKVQLALAKLAPDEKLEKIESISYIDSRKKSFAFVFYRSNIGISNIVIQHEVTATEELLVSTTKCDGGECDCKVSTVIKDNGDVDVKCSCATCSMIIR